MKEFTWLFLLMLAWVSIVLMVGILVPLYLL